MSISFWSRRKAPSRVRQPAATSRDQLSASGHLETWRTAVLYQLLHAVALLALSGWREAHGGPDRSVAGCWVTGVVLFSGSLYWLSLGGPAFLGSVTPLGGIILLTGWYLVARNAWKAPAA